VAAFVLAVERFVAGSPQHGGRLSLLLTSDEEGPAADGVRRVVPELERRDLLPDHVLVGEPSSSQRLGDVIRIGRRGSIQARLVVRGIQGHTAYARPEDNPVHRGAALVAALAALRFDDGDSAFPATTLQISNLRAGTGADNVTPGELELLFNLRHNPNSPADVLEHRVRELIATVGPADAELHWRISGAPFGPASGPLRDAVEQAVASRFGEAPRADTGGGTSDGRFFGPRGIETVELGPVNRSIHRIDERISIEDLERRSALDWSATNGSKPSRLRVFMRIIIIILVILLIALQLEVWHQHGRVGELQQRVEEQRQNNQELAARNAALEAEVVDLRSGLDAVEERARAELGLIRDGEEFFLVVDPDDLSPEDLEVLQRLRAAPAAVPAVDG
jgi:succinyl-diaminopimelate desuccinylase